MEGNHMQNHIALQMEMESAIDSGETMDAVENGFEHGGRNVVLRQTGTSRMEMMVPELRMHTLSYLDCPSLCRLSMTNSLMNKAANDEMAWKTLYHKDFTLELADVRPVSGWKAFYATTRAVVNTNTEFFKIVKERSLSAMSKFWFEADYVKWFPATGESFSGHNEVMEGWQLAFSWENVADSQIQNVRTRVLEDVAWVTMKADVGMENGLCNITNVYELHNGKWYMVLHQSTASPIQAEADEEPLEA